MDSLSENTGLSSRQTAWLMFLDIFAAGFFMLPFWLKAVSFGSRMTAGTVSIVLVILFYSLGFLLPGDKWCGRIARLWPIRCFYLAFVFFFLILGLRQYRTLIGEFVLPVSNGRLALLLMTACITFGACHGMTVRGRAAQLLGWLITLPFLVFLIFGIFQAPASGWQAFNFQLDQISFLKGCQIAPLFLIVDQPLMLRSYMQAGIKSKKQIYLHILTAGVVVWLALLLTGIYLSDTAVSSEAQPVLILLQLIQFPGNFIARYDVFFEMLWMLADYILLSGLLIHACNIVSSFKAAGSQYGRKIISVVMGVLVFVISIL